MPAVVLAIAFDTEVVALESQRKKCDFIERRLQSGAAESGRGLQPRRRLRTGIGSESFDIAVSRAVATLPTVAELIAAASRRWLHGCDEGGNIETKSLYEGDGPRYTWGSSMTRGHQSEPFEDAENPWVYRASKRSATPGKYPRRRVFRAKRPLGKRSDQATSKK